VGSHLDRRGIREDLEEEGVEVIDDPKGRKGTMNWNEQAQLMAKSWTEIQKKLWEGWIDAGAQHGASGASAGVWTDWITQWQKMAQQALEAWSAGAEGVPKDAARRLFAGEETFFRFVELSLEAFKSLAPKIEAGEDWADLLRQHIDQLKEGMTQKSFPWLSGDFAAAATRDVPELWKLFGAQMKDLTTPWFESLREARGNIGEAMSGDRRAFVKTFNVFMDTFEGTAGKFASAPALGFTREFQEKLAKAFEAWMDVRRAEVDFATESANIGFKALESLLRELVQKGERGEKITNLRQLFDLWVSTADKTFFQAASTEGFAEIQGRLVNAAMRQRIREREATEVFLRNMHVPTRKEIDDAYRHMYDLRREVKALRKELNRLRNEMAPAVGKPAGRRAAVRTRSGYHGVEPKTQKGG
jgi:class III poly(R)-hydroxyalkanoic acid synthase PhaE subunit